MFVVSREPHFTHPVAVQVPVDGGHVEQTFKATFRVIDNAKLDSFDLNTVEGSRDFLVAVIVKLDDLVDEQEKPLPYSDALRDQLIGNPYVSLALGRTYREAIKKAARGN